MKSLEIWLGLAFKNIDFKNKLKQLNAWVDEDWQINLRSYINNTKKWNEVMELFMDRLKLTHPMMGRIQSFMGLKSLPDMEFA